MHPPLDGTVLVTGASAGIGEALARQLASRARRLVLVARREERLQALASVLRRERTGRSVALKVEVHACDLGDPGARTRMLDAVEQGGPIDVLVNNAGFGDQSLFERGRWDKLERMLGLNVVALTHLAHRVVPGMVERGRGGVLNISSGFGLSAFPGVAVYVGTKHYVSGFSEALRAEVGHRGVVVTQVCPGPVLTEFHEVSENTTGLRPPRFAAISAEQCATEALEGFERGRAMVVPGFVIRNLLRLHAITPRWLWRRVTVRMARAMRAAEASPHEPAGEA
ncbi:SDR family NAD(P)-dependent oxidoreductase [Paraliomyxa miuraensis]|uniref:SDR family NAD(P)-dependent oxidoreductase n=1 Tax=Paraliomyxa miuraensis TaxID=376150 RepID=UPI00225085F8|nr:SDR family oxidoreductase [Paraliomyxa miuraensis]MCX4243123.1 SDR family oxidoreductase [Paraliomyxa miuraensis]